MAPKEVLDAINQGGEARGGDEEVGLRLDVSREGLVRALEQLKAMKRKEEAMVAEEYNKALAAKSATPAATLAQPPLNSFAVGRGFTTDYPTRLAEIRKDRAVIQSHIDALQQTSRLKRAWRWFTDA